MDGILSQSPKCFCDNGYALHSSIPTSRKILGKLGCTSIWSAWPGETESSARVSCWRGLITWMSSAAGQLERARYQPRNFSGGEQRQLTEPQQKLYLGWSVMARDTIPILSTTNLNPHRYLQFHDTQDREMNCCVGGYLTNTLLSNETLCPIGEGQEWRME